jgi:predicted transglutaminase-like cysteine proteinase
MNLAPRSMPCQLGYKAKNKLSGGQMGRGILRGLVTLTRGQLIRRASGMGLALAAFLVVQGAEPTSAKPASPVASAQGAIQAAGQAGPTPAWIKFCQRLPRECGVDRSEPATITLNQQTWDSIVETNEQVNRTVLAVTDQDYWGVADRWDYPDDGMGDCEDIQLLKRRRLIEAGLPRRALRMTVVIDEQGAGHAVLMVRTDRGDLILDNTRDAVLPWQETGYTFVKREGTESAAWVWLGGQPAPVATANR